jgi:nucleotidyltransferase/DNA polymerase involved in DNA repair
MLAVRLCGPRVITRLESIGIRSLGDLAHRQPDDLVQEVNIQAGRPIWHPPMATQAMANLIAAARQSELR